MRGTLALVALLVAVSCVHCDARSSGKLSGILAGSPHLKALDDVFVKVKKLGRGFKAAADDPDCPAAKCNAPAFLIPAINAQNLCTSERGTLLAGLTAANTTAAVDAAWNSFCTSTCNNAIGGIQKSDYCCIGGASGAFFGLVVGCRVNTVTTRRCGAELSNMAGFACAGTSPGTCVGSGLSCEWDTVSSRCTFHPTTTALNSLCTTCVRDFITTFPGGGLQTVSVRNQVSAAYSTFCAKIDGQYCLETAQRYEYKDAKSLNGTQLDSLCAATPSAITDRMCMRAIGTGVAESLRRSSVSARSTCLYGDAICGAIESGTQALGFMVDRVTANLCTKTPSGDLCLKKAVLLADPCVMDTLMNNRCNSSCATNIQTFTSAMGCCGKVFLDMAYPLLTLPSSYRDLMDNRALALTAVMNRTKNTTRALPSPAVRTLVESAIGLGTIASNPMVRLTNCSDFNASFLADGSCVQHAASMNLRLNLNISFNKLMNETAARDEFLANIKVDLAISLGLSTWDITDANISSNAVHTLRIFGADVPSTNYDFRVLGDSQAHVDAIKAEIMRQVSDGTMSLTLATSDMFANCEACLFSLYAPVANFAEENLGNSTTTPVSSGTALVSSVASLIVAATVTIMAAM